MIIRVTRALSLTQPWATLVAILAKRHETRGWATKYRGPLAIHAAKSFPKACRALCYQRPFADALAAAGYNHPGELPLGQVLAISDLADCMSTNHWTPPRESREYAFGDYSANRHSFTLEDTRRIKPFEARGSLSIWELPRAITAEDLL